jgi:hypothetical protein
MKLFGGPLYADACQRRHKAAVPEARDMMRRVAELSPPARRSRHSVGNAKVGSTRLRAPVPVSVRQYPSLCASTRVRARGIRSRAASTEHQKARQATNFNALHLNYHNSYECCAYSNQIA